MIGKSLKIFLAYFSILPLQRVLNKIAAALAGIGVIVCFFNLAGGIVTIASAVGALVVFPLLFALGYGFRAISATQAFNLTPNFRLAMLGSVFVLFVLLLGFWLGFNLLVGAVIVDAQSGRGIGASTGAGIPFFSVLAYGFAFVTVWFAVTYRISDPPQRILFLDILLLFVFMLMLTGQNVFIVPGVINWPIVWMVAACLFWIVFARWYLTTEKISPPQYGAMSGEVPNVSNRGLPGAESSSVNNKPIDIVLRGGVPPVTERGFAVLVGSMLGLIGILYLITYLEDGGAVPLFLILALVILWVHTGRAGFVGSRARYLWLSSGYSRTELLSESSRVIRQLMQEIASLVAITLVAGKWFWPEWSWLSIGYAAIAILASALSLHFWCLYRIHGWRYTDVLLALVIFLLGMVPLTAIAPPGFVMVQYWPSIAALVLLAIGLRYAARSRWLSIDWSRYRPARISARSAAGANR